MTLHTFPEAGNDTQQDYNFEIVDCIPVVFDDDEMDEAGLISEGSDPV